MPATMTEVAAKAGVSIKTVSNVINNRPYITTETRERVLAAIADLHYKPNRTAQALRSRRVQALAAIIPDIQNPFFTQVVHGIEDTAFAAGYMLFLCDTEDREAREMRYIEGLSSGTIAGAVLCAADPRSFRERVEALQRGHVAVVAIDRASPDVPVDAVLSENEEGSYAAVQHLLALGHRRIGMIAGPEYFLFGQERLDGYLRAHAEYGVAVAPELISRADFRRASAETAANRLLDLPAPPTALFVYCGPMAVGAVKAIRTRGLKMPADLALIVFDDVDWSEAGDPPLSVVAQPAYEMGCRAADLLIRRLDQPQAPAELVRLPTKFVHRGSCCHLNEARPAERSQAEEAMEGTERGGADRPGPSGPETDPAIGSHRRV